MPHLEARLARNLQSIRQRIDGAARRVGRTGTEVTMVGVAKYVDKEVTAALVRAGCHDIGENRPQVLWEKSAALAEDSGSEQVRWHMIGHLQRNKVDRTVPRTHLIHSVDSERLLRTIERSAAKLAMPSVAILLEVNISDDVNKQGWKRTDMASVLESLAAYPHIRVEGLMAMAAWDRRGESARRDFSRLRELRDSLRKTSPDNAPLHHLSMGMSGDFEVAIEEGATIVRIGSAIFESCLD